MKVRRGYLALGSAALAVIALAMPAIGAPSDVTRKLLSKRPASAGARAGIGSYTPAAADPRVAAMLARAGLANSGFRFTPAGGSKGKDKSVTVAVRAASSAPMPTGTRVTAAPQAVSIAPIAYNLGMAVGWKRFALSGDVSRVDMAGLPGSREKLDVGVSYNAPKWSARIQAGQDRPTDPITASLTGGRSYNLDVGGSYSIARNLDVTAGLRYKAEDRNRLQIVDDGRRDSQAVYVGTAIRF